MSCTSNTCQFHIRNISRIRKYIPQDTSVILIKSLVMSRLDYSNGLLYGLPKCTVSGLQAVQNSAACIVTQERLRDHDSMSRALMSCTGCQLTRVLSISCCYIRIRHCMAWRQGIFVNWLCRMRYGESAECGCCCLPRPGPSSKSIVEVAKRTIYSNRSSGDKSVGCVVQANRCLTSCGEAPQSVHI